MRASVMRVFVAAVILGGFVALSPVSSAVMAATKEFKLALKWTPKEAPDLKAINFTETYSGAISDLMVKLLQTPEFKAALKKSKA